MNIEKYIDHTILKADAKKDEVIRYCNEAKEYGFASVCVNTSYVPLVSKELLGTDVKTCCVVGFPLGAMSTKAKVFETLEAIKDGADEIDMVINIGALKDKDLEFVENDIKAVLEATKKEDKSKILKVIIETALLTDDEKKEITKIVRDLGADYVKTSTGFSSAGAKLEDIKLMKEIVGDKIKIKASGGIRTNAQALELIEAGADRIGAGNGIILLN